MERPPRTNLVGGWRGEERAEFVVLAVELLGATTPELFEVAQLSLKSGQLFQTREGQDMPGGSEGEEGREELARMWGHALKNVPTESTSHFVQLLDRRDRPGDHPHQCKYIEILAGLSAFLIAYPDFEQVALVLPVERRNLLAGIDLRGGEGGRHQSKQELHSSLIVAGQHGGSTNVEPSSMVPTQREFAAGAYGFGAQRYWSSTFGLSSWATCRYFDDGQTAGCMLLHPYPSRPI